MNTYASCNEPLNNPETPPEMLFSRQIMFEAKNILIMFQATNISSHKHVSSHKHFVVLKTNHVWSQKHFKEQHNPSCPHHDANVAHLLTLILFRPSSSRVPPLSVHPWKILDIPDDCAFQCCNLAQYASHKLPACSGARLRHGSCLCLPKSAVPIWKY